MLAKVPFPAAHKALQNRSRIIVCRGYTSMCSIVRYRLRKEIQLVIQKGDITEWRGDAVVNAANERMLGGGGVDGAIHRAAGPELLQACRRYPDSIRERCPTGDARVTLGYDMPCKWVIHTVGPIFSRKKARECEAHLISAYRASLAVANGIGATTVAFPAISCGIYGYPLRDACFAALTACHEFCGDLEEVHFVLFGSDTYDVWRAQADEHLQPILGSAGSEETQASEPKPVQDGSSPMQGTMPPVDDGASPMQVRLSPDTSPTNPLKQGHDNVQLKDESPLGSLQNDTSIQTLTGVKVGEAGESAQEAMAAPEVLEAAAPAQQSGLSRRGPSTDSSEAAEDKQFSHTKGQSNADCSAAKDTGTSSM